MSSRKNREFAAEMAVGALVAAVFAGLAVFTIAISGKSLFRKNVFEMEAVMPDAMGLRANDPVIARGTTVGSVTHVAFERDGVHVKARLEAPVEFHEGYEIVVVSTSILGGRQLVLREGDPAAPVVADVTSLRGKQPSDLMEDASAAVAKVREFLDTDALDNFRAFSENLKTVGARIENGEGTLGKLLSSDDALYADLAAAVADAKEAIADLKSIAARLEAGEGTIGKLLSSDDTVYRNLDAAVADAKDAIADLKSIADRLEKGEGTLGKLLSSDDSAYKDLADTLANLRSITDRLEKGEGTLGRLLSSDDELYRNVNGTVTDARELLDDMREANTLSTFTSLLFSGF
ncbi:MAG: MCE family protein [Kiritimatiellae bacterium]|nr:MCE family protein [Kiritimatiellia bacterium]